MSLKMPGELIAPGVYSVVTENILNAAEQRFCGA
jgi:hypothetical protein